MYNPLQAAGCTKAEVSPLKGVQVIGILVGKRRNAPASRARYTLLYISQIHPCLHQHDWNITKMDKQYAGVCALRIYVRVMASTDNIPLNSTRCCVDNSAVYTTTHQKRTNNDV